MRALDVALVAFFLYWATALMLKSEVEGDFRVVVAQRIVAFLLFIAVGLALTF